MSFAASNQPPRVNRRIITPMPGVPLLGRGYSPPGSVVGSVAICPRPTLTYARGQIHITKPNINQSYLDDGGTSAPTVGRSAGSELRATKVVEGGIGGRLEFRSADSNGARMLASAVHGGPSFEPRAAKVIGGGLRGTCNIHGLLANQAQLKTTRARSSDRCAQDPAITQQSDVVASREDQLYYHIVVTNLTGDSIEVQCKPLDTIDMVKEKIYENMGHPQFIQKLIFQEQLLTYGNSTLKELDVVDGSILTLVLDLEALRAAEAAALLNERTLFHNYCFEVIVQLLRSDRASDRMELHRVKAIGEGERLKARLLQETVDARTWLYDKAGSVDEIRKRRQELRQKIAASGLLALSVPE